MTTFLRIAVDNDTGHWAAHARQWSRIGSPLRPHADDIAIVRGWLADEQLIEAGGCGVLLGVTPELVQASTRYLLIAIDRERAMIDMLHAQPDNTSEVAIQGDWLALPFAPDSLNFAIGDGSFNLLRYPQDHHALFAQLRRVMRSRAPLIMRVFTRPATDENCATVISAAFEGHINSFHAFKWRFAMALAARNRNPNIGVADIHREFEAWIPDRDALATAAGWSRAAIDTIDVYRDSCAVYSFPSAEEWSAVAARYSEEITRGHGNYELAERCPIVLSRLFG